MTTRAYLREWWPFLVPLVAAAAVFAVQPGDQLGWPGDEPFKTRLLYDDADMGAYALRGLNANLGRPPGPVEPDLVAPEVFDQAVEFGPDPPPLDRYFLEYPHAALFLFRAVAALAPHDGPWPNAVLDANYANLIFHVPHTPRERALWRTFRWIARGVVALNVLALLAMMLVLKRGLGPDGTWAGPVWLLVLPASLYFVQCRFDTLPSLFVVLGLAAAGRGRVGPSGLAFGVATALKLYPLVVAPLVWRHLTTDARRGVVWAAAFLLPLAVVFGAGAALDGIDGVRAPFQFQLGRKLDPETWTFYGPLLPASLADSSAGRLGAVAAVLVGLFVLPRRGLGSVLRRCAVVLIVFANLQVFYSPQWVLWFVPLLVPEARRSRPLLGLLVMNDVMTYASFPLAFDVMASSVTWSWERGMMIGWRAATLALLLAYLAWAEVRALRGPAGRESAR